MSNYCPQCLGEYKDSVKICPKDNSPLTHSRPAAYERLVDFYVAVDELEAERLLSLLEAEGIIARESVSGISQLPVASDKRFTIAVLRDDMRKARSFVEQARHDDILSKKGSFC